MALARPARTRQFFLVAIAFGCLAASFVGNDFSVQNVATNSNSELPLHYRIAATWGSHEGSLLLWVLMLTGWTFAVTCFSRNLPQALLARVLCGDGAGERGLPAVPAVHLESVRSAVPAGARGPRPESAAAGSGHGDPSADALHGLRRLLRRVRVRDRGAARRPARRDLGALVAAVDDGRVGVPHRRHRARQRLGLLRAGLGRLVVLGSGRERLVHALAGRAPRSSIRSRSPRSAARSRAGPCCSRSSRSRCRCSEPSSCAPAC